MVTTIATAYCNVEAKHTNPLSLNYSHSAHSCYIAGFIVVALSATQVIDDHIQGILGTNSQFRCPWTILILSIFIIIDDDFDDDDDDAADDDDDRKR